MTVYIVSHENVSYLSTRYEIVGVYSSQEAAQAAITAVQVTGKTSTSNLEQYLITSMEVQD